MGFCPHINAGFRPSTVCHFVFVEGSEPRLSRWTSHCQSFSPAFIRSVTASFMHSFTHLCVHFPTHSSFIHSFTHSLNHSFIHSLTYSLTHSFVHVRSTVPTFMSFNDTPHTNNSFDAFDFPRGH